MTWWNDLENLYLSRLYIAYMQGYYDYVTAAATEHNYVNRTS
jgi:hypothetical protein